MAAFLLRRFCVQRSDTPVFADAHRVKLPAASITPAAFCLQCGPGRRRHGRADIAGQIGPVNAGLLVTLSFYHVRVG